MPRHVSPGRSPSPSRSPSRSSRKGYTYTDGVYTPSNSESYSPSPTRSRSRRRKVHSPPRSDSYYSRSRSRSRSRSTARTSGTRSHLSSVLDTSSNTKQEKAENVVKTSLVMLGAIGAATLAAHKFWPKGITYSEKEEWEMEHAKKKGKEKQAIRDKLREGRDAITDRHDTERGREPSRESRGEQRLPLPPNAAGDLGALYWEQRDRRITGRRYDDYDDYDDYNGNYYPRDHPRVRRYSATDISPQRRPSTRALEVILPPSQVHPNSLRNYADEPAPLVIPDSVSTRDSIDVGREGRGGYYVDGSTIVLSSSREREYIIRRDAPPGQRLRARDMSRGGEYYR